MFFIRNFIPVNSVEGRVVRVVAIHRLVIKNRLMFVGKNLKEDFLLLVVI